MLQIILAGIIVYAFFQVGTLVYEAFGIIGLLFFLMCLWEIIWVK